MKRILSVVLLVCMLLPLIAMAEESFSLRNGYYWGMSQPEALALAEADGLEISAKSRDERQVNYSDVFAESFPAQTMNLCFDQDQNLNSIIYAFKGEEKSGEYLVRLMYDSLKSNLSYYHGNPIMDAAYSIAIWDTSYAYITLMYGESISEPGKMYCSLSYRKPVY